MSSTNNPEPLKIYELYLADVGRIGDRHQALRAFYVSLIGALTGLLALAGGEKAVFPGSKLNGGLLVAAAGFAVCIMWFAHMGSFRAIFDAKFKTLRAIEGKLTVAPFESEWSALQQSRYVHLTTIDQFVAAILALAFLFLFLLGTGVV